MLKSGHEMKLVLGNTYTVLYVIVFTSKLSKILLSEKIEQVKEKDSQDINLNN